MTMYIAIAVVVVLAAMWYMDQGKTSAKAPKDLDKELDKLVLTVYKAQVAKAAADAELMAAKVAVGASLTAIK